MLTIPNTITPTIVASRVKILWLMSDQIGLLCQKGGGNTLYYSTDGVGLVPLHTFPNALSYNALELANGELLVSLNESGMSGGELWLSTNFPTAGVNATWAKVLTAGGGDSAIFQSGWGISARGQYVAACEYGDTGRYVWLSDDYGATWSEIADLADHVPGGDLTGHHWHGVIYDPTWDNVWATWGDTTEGVIVTEDAGVTWHNVSYDDVSATTQLLGGISTDRYILFTSDCSPNGIYRVDRSVGGDDASNQKLELAYTMSDSGDIITHLFRQTFQLVGVADAPILFPYSGWLGGETPSGLLVTYDGDTFTEVWKSSVIQQLSSLRFAVGPSLTNMLYGGHNDGGIDYRWEYDLSAFSVSAHGTEMDHQLLAPAGVIVYALAYANEASLSDGSAPSEKCLLGYEQGNSRLNTRHSGTWHDSTITFEEKL